MEELRRIVQLFNDLQYGECWIGVNLRSVLQGVDARTAAFQPAPGRNCIWQLANHLIYWRSAVMLRLQGQDAYPEGEDMYMPALRDEKTWRQTLLSFESNFSAFVSELARFDAALLYKSSPKPGQTYHQLVMGCLQHDAYHMGQIAMLSKLAS